MVARNRHLAALSIAVSFVALTGAFSCNLSRTIGSDTPEDSTGQERGSTFQHRLEGRSETIQGTYQVQGNRLVSRLLDRDSVYESRDCGVSSTGRPDSLIVYRDTIQAADTLAWSIRRDSLVLSYWQDTAYTNVDSVPTITEWIYARTSGSGSTLEGTFRIVGMRDRFLKPLPTASYDSVSMLQTWANSKRYFSEIQTVEMAFQNGRLVTTNRMIPTWADMVVMRWTGQYLGATADSTWYDIDLKRIDDTTVTETGRVTREVVTRRKLRAKNPLNLQSGDVSYTSSDTSHHAGIAHENPTTCPDGVDWFGNFRVDNWKRSFSARKTPFVETPRRGVSTKGVLRTKLNLVRIQS